MRAKTEQRGDARIEPADRIGKIHGAQWANLIAFGERNLPTTGTRAAVQRENQRAVEVRSVVRAGSVAEVMFEVLKLHAFEMLAEFAKTGGLPGILGGAALRGRAELRAESGLAQARLLREIGERRQI